MITCITTYEYVLVTFPDFPASERDDVYACTTSMLRSRVWEPGNEAEFVQDRNGLSTKGAGRNQKLGIDFV